jgi:hypothetical protein
VTAAVAIPLATTVAGLFIALPAHPTVAQRIGQAAAALAIGLALVAALAFLYAVFVAPYEQRRMLRKELAATQDELDDFRDSIHETFELKGLDITRGCPEREYPEIFESLEFSLRFQNEAATPIKYSMQHISVDVNGLTVTKTDAAHDSYRIGPGAFDTYVFGWNLPRRQTGPAIGTLHYRVWYGPKAEPDLYQQDYTYEFRNNPLIDPSKSNTSYWRRPGGRDERRPIAIEEQKSQHLPP